jgi:hypothetical protein
VPFRVPNSIKLVKIDRTTGRYPNPSTPKEKIFFEALKIEDEIDENQENEIKDENNENSKTDQNPQEESLDSLIKDNQPTGIY